MMESCHRVNLRDILSFFKKNIVFAGSAIIVFEDSACLKKCLLTAIQLSCVACEVVFRFTNPKIF